MSRTSKSAKPCGEVLAWGAYRYLIENFDFQNDPVIDMLNSLSEAGFLKVPDSDDAMNYYRHSFCNQNCGWIEHHPDCETCQ